MSLFRFSEDELKLETLELVSSDINLSTTAIRCDVCKTGNVTNVGREANIVIYTRSGTNKGVHHEKRCNNRALPCRAGHYYGFLRDGTTKIVEDDALQKEFLITSNQTAFAVDYLWDITLQILFSRATFESLGQIYNNLHFTNLRRGRMCSQKELVKHFSPTPTLNLVKHMVLK